MEIKGLGIQIKNHLLKLERPILHYFTGAIAHHLSFTRSILYTATTTVSLSKGALDIMLALKTSLHVLLNFLYCCCSAVQYWFTSLILHSPNVIETPRSPSPLIAVCWMFRWWVLLGSQRTACSCCPYALHSTADVHPFIHSSKPGCCSLVVGGWLGKRSLLHATNCTNYICRPIIN